MAIERLARPGDVPTGLPNCGLMAVCLVSGVPYQDAVRWWRRTYRRPGNWKGGTRKPERERFLVEHGFRLTGLPTVFGGCYRMTLERYVRLYVPRGRVAIITTTGHVQVVRDGLVIDQSYAEGVPVSDYWGRRKYVNEAIIVERDQ